jgi:hypothetical protein
MPGAGSYVLNSDGVLHIFCPLLQSTHSRRISEPDTVLARIHSGGLDSNAPEPGKTLRQGETQNKLGFKQMLGRKVRYCQIIETGSGAGQHWVRRPCAEARRV